MSILTVNIYFAKASQIRCIEPSFWKPATENQKYNNYNRRLGPWKNAGEEMTLTSIDLSQNDGILDIIIHKQISLGAEYTLTYNINNEGKVKVTADYNPTKTDLPLMPKLGMRLKIKPSFEQITWYSRGEYENYPDRKSKASTRHAYRRIHQH